jgi:hypothetical protein
MKRITVKGREGIDMVAWSCATTAMEDGRDELDVEPKGEARSPSERISFLDAWECGVDSLGCRGPATWKADD